jgi:hypothetical protein
MYMPRRREKGATNHDLGVELFAVAVLANPNGRGLPHDMRVGDDHLQAHAVSTDLQCTLAREDRTSSCTRKPEPVHDSWRPICHGSK